MHTLYVDVGTILQVFLGPGDRLWCVLDSHITV